MMIGMTCTRANILASEIHTRLEIKIPLVWACRTMALVVFLFFDAFVLPEACRAQVDYVARFTLEKQKFMVGEPIFCDFVIKNTGTRAFGFRYRSPDRSLN